MSGPGAFARLLAGPGVEEVVEQRGRFGFMAFHGGGLEAMTDVIAARAAEAAGASFYAVLHPDDLEHLPSALVTPAESPRLARFLAAVDVVITLHGYGRPGFWHHLLLGGRNRDLAGHVATHLAAVLPAYELVTDLDDIPVPLRGLNPANPVNLPRHGGVQIELPPRVRGTTPLWADWDGPGLNPHTAALVDGLAAAARTWALPPVGR